MRSLYSHEHLAHRYTELDDGQIMAAVHELHHIKDTTEVPRQREVATRLIGYAAFELTSRLSGGFSGTVRE